MATYNEGATGGAGTRIEPLEDRRLLSLSPLGAELTIAASSAAYNVVNETGTGGYFNGSPGVATSSRGDAVVVWAADGADGVDVYARRYAPGGVPAGDAFVVNTSGPGDQAQPGVGVAEDGSFVVSWTSRGTGPTPGVYARRFGGDGQALGDEFLVAANPSDMTLWTRPGSTRVALAADGRFAVAWKATNVYVRTYGASGDPQGGAVQVSATAPTTSGYANLYGTFVDTEGTYTLVFDNGDRQLSGRRYSAAGAPLTGIVDLRNGDTTYGSAGSPAMDPVGDLVVPWWSATTNFVYARRFNPDLTPAGSAFYVSERAKSPAAAVDSAGNVTIAFTYNTAPADQVWLKTFPAGGAPGATFHVIGATHRGEGAVAVTGDGSVFELSRDEDTTRAVYGRWYQGFTNPASLGDRVWRDANADGVQGPADYGVYQATVTLFNDAGVEIQTTTTDAYGHYAFPEVMSGQAVYVQVTPRSDYFPSPLHRGTDPTLDSDLDPLTWRTDLMTLAPDEVRTDLDLGLIPYATVSGTVYHDADEDGVRGAGEAALSGWTVYADVDGDGQLDPGEPSAVTPRDGTYTLWQVPPGAVTIRLVAQSPWDAPVARPMTLAPGQVVRSVNWANTTRVLRGEPRAVGPLVNPTGSGDAWLALDGQRRSVVAWVAGGKVYVQRFDASLAPLGAPDVVATDAEAIYARVTASDAGEFIVSWRSAPRTPVGPATSRYTYARRYDAAARPLTDAYRVRAQRTLVVFAMFKSGGWAQTYVGTDGLAYLERYAADGTPVGAPVQVAPGVAGAGTPSVAADANGALVVAWIQPEAADNAKHDVFARAFRADGSAASDPFQVNTAVAQGDQYNAAVAGAGDGQFVVAFYDSPGLQVCVRRVGLSGPVGGEIVGSTSAVNAAGAFAIALAPSGDFVVTAGAYAMHFSAAGVPSVRTLLLTSSYSTTPTGVGFDAAGDFVAATVEYSAAGFPGARGLLLQRVVVPPAVARLARPATAGPTDLRLRVSDDAVVLPTAGQVVVRELGSGRVLDPAEYAWDFDPATGTATFKLRDVGSTAADGNYRLTVPAGAVTDAAGNAMSADLTLDFFVLAGDANQDRVVNFADLLTLTRNYNKTGATWADGDFTGDGVVNFADLLIVTRAYNKTLPAPAPEPPALAAVELAPATGSSVLADDSAQVKPVFSTTPVVKPAPKPGPAKPKAVAKPKGR